MANWTVEAPIGGRGFLKCAWHNANGGGEILQKRWTHPFDIRTFEDVERRLREMPSPLTRAVVDDFGSLAIECVRGTDRVVRSRQPSREFSSFSEREFQRLWDELVKPIALDLLRLGLPGELIEECELCGDANRRSLVVSEDPHWLRVHPEELE